MLGIRISNTIFFTILTNYIICDLVKEGNENAKDEEKMDRSKKLLYEIHSRNVFNPFSQTQHFQPDFPVGQDSLVKPPLILSLGFGSLGGFKDLAPPLDLSNSFRVHQEGNSPLLGGSNAFVGNPIHRFPVGSLLQGFQEEPFSYAPFHNFDSGGNNEPPSWMKPKYPMNGFSGYNNLKLPYQFLIPALPELSYSGPPLANQIRDHNLASVSNSPHSELLKSLGYVLPTRISNYQPVTSAKDYFTDVPSQDTSVDQNYDSQSLLLGELGDDTKKDEEQEEEQTMTSSIDISSQYHHDNRKPIMFHYNKMPKNIYEIISAEKLIPREIDMTVAGRNSRPTMISNNDKNMAQGSDVITVKSVDYKNGTVFENNTNGKNKSDLEILLTEEAVFEKEDGGEYDAFSEKDDPESEGTFEMLAGEESKNSEAKADVLEKILKNAYKLKGKGHKAIYIAHDLGKEDQKINEHLREHLNLAKKSGKKATIRGNTLIIKDIGTKLAEQMEILNRPPPKRKRHTQYFFLRPTIPAEVRSAVETLKSGKSSGYNGIRAETLKVIGEEISKPFAIIINKIFETGICPEQFKLAIIAPIYKKGDKR
ncbi:hypothetical protein JTB14_001725 [Gonioctena quinquepunctata]|nr:hypothetical protein JTB14_001725 [Gonioctena quinquepunctata]